MNKNTKLLVRIVCLALAVALIASLGYTLFYSIFMM